MRQSGLSHLGGRLQGHGSGDHSITARPPALTFSGRRPAGGDPSSSFTISPPFHVFFFLLGFLEKMAKKWIPFSQKLTSVHAVVSLVCKESYFNECVCVKV